jgi:hypothetical protein
MNRRLIHDVSYAAATALLGLVGTNRGRGDCVPGHGAFYRLVKQALESYALQQERLDARLQGARAARPFPPNSEANGAES